MLLSPYADTIGGILLDSGVEIVAFGDVDWVVCYGHRQIIKGDFLTKYVGRIVNLHISYLPWNRGSDPNLWSWYDKTPKGVSFHYIDAGIDTGEIIAQRTVEFEPSDTLASSYKTLQRSAVKLFSDTWPELVRGNVGSQPQRRGQGSYHRSADKVDLMKRLPLGFDTPCLFVEHLGMSMRKQQRG